MVLGAAKSEVACFLAQTSALASDTPAAHEDRTIGRLSRALLRHFDRRPELLAHLPLPADWLEQAFTRRIESRLLAHLGQCQRETQHPWTIAARETAHLLPLWRRVFDALNCEPRFVLCLRDPRAALVEMQITEDLSAPAAELAWIGHHLDAVLRTGGRLNVFRWESWHRDRRSYLARLESLLGADDEVQVVEQPPAPRLDEHEHPAADVARKDVELSVVTRELYRALTGFAAGAVSSDELLAYATDLRDQAAELPVPPDSLAFLHGRLTSARRGLARSAAAQSRAARRVAELSERKALMESRIDPARPVPADLVLRLRRIPSIPPCRVVAGVASYAAREPVFAQSVASILPQVDHLFVFLNDYASIPAFLDDARITVFRSQDYWNLSAIGKTFALGELDDCYFFSLDDDILFPPDYVERMLATMHKYGDKVGVAVHGSVLPEHPGWYFERSVGYPFQAALASDRFVNLIGSGTFAFRTSVLRARFEDFLPHVMVDLRFSILAKDQGVPLVCVARPRMWLTGLANQEGLYQDMRIGVTVHTTECIAHAPWGYERYRQLVAEALPAHLLELSPDQQRALDLDVEFLAGLETGEPPPSWGVTPTLTSKIEERAFAFNPLGEYLALKDRLQRTEERHRRQHAGMQQWLRRQQGLAPSPSARLRRVVRRLRQLASRVLGVIRRRVLLRPR